MSSFRVPNVCVLLHPRALASKRPPLHVLPRPSGHQPSRPLARPPPHNSFGANDLKAAGMSPDGAVQASIQLANFLVNGKLYSQQEIASTQGFKEGRLDMVRCVTRESAA